MTSENTMISIVPGSISLGNVPFDLYISEKDKLMLFCKSGYVVTQKHLDMLESHDRMLLINDKDMALYEGYAADHINSIINHTNISLEEKGKVLGVLGQKAARKVMNQPHNPETVDTAEMTVSSYIDLTLSYNEVTEAFFSMNTTDDYTLTHAVNVSALSLLLGREMFGNDRDKLLKLGMAGMLHDIGMAKVSPEILLKETRLDGEEWRIVRRHPITSYEILTKHKLPVAILTVARSHHERMDGSGYPDGLSGNEIPPFARIVAVADVYDAITSHRSYSKERPHIEALKEIGQEHKKFDPNVIDALLKIVLKNTILIREFKRKYFSDDA